MFFFSIKILANTIGEVDKNSIDRSGRKTLKINTAIKHKLVE